MTSAIFMSVKLKQLNINMKNNPGREKKRKTW